MNLFALVTLIVKNIENDLIQQEVVIDQEGFQLLMLDTRKKSKGHKFGFDNLI